MSSKTSHQPRPHTVRFYDRKTERLFKAYLLSRKQQLGVRIFSEQQGLEELLKGSLTDWATRRAPAPAEAPE